MNLNAGLRLAAIVLWATGLVFGFRSIETEPASYRWMAALTGIALAAAGLFLFLLAGRRAQMA